MIASPIVAFVLTQLLEKYNLLVFLVEVSGIYAFAAYWWFKSREMKETEAELLAVQGKLRRVVKPRAVVDEMKVERSTPAGAGSRPGNAGG